MQIEDVTENDLLIPSKIAEILHTSMDEVAMVLGLEKDDLNHRTCIEATDTQRRLRDFVAILTHVTPRFDSALLVYAWYRSDPLPGFGDLTAMQLVQDGKYRSILEYLDAIDAGVYA